MIPFGNAHVVSIIRVSFMGGREAGGKGQHSPTPPPVVEKLVEGGGLNNLAIFRPINE